MSHNDDIIKLRKRVLDAVSIGMDISSNLYEGTLIQIMNEAERNRQTCVSQAENLRKQASILDGQAAGYSATSSIIYNVLNGYILQEQKRQREEEERKLEKEEVVEVKVEEIIEEKKKIKKK